MLNNLVSLGMKNHGNHGNLLFELWAPIRQNCSRDPTSDCRDHFFSLCSRYYQLTAHYLYSHAMPHRNLKPNSDIGPYTLRKGLPSKHISRVFHILDKMDMNWYLWPNIGKFRLMYCIIGYFLGSLVCGDCFMYWYIKDKGGMHWK